MLYPDKTELVYIQFIKKITFYGHFPHIWDTSCENIFAHMQTVKADTCSLIRAFTVHIGVIGYYRM